jgi:NADH-quinone oxidoreductase subunit G
LSRLAPGIAELMPRAFIALNATDGLRMGIKPGELMKVSIGSSVYELELSLRPDVPRGVALLPVGIPPIDGVSLPAPGKLTPAAATVHGLTK